MAVPAPLTDDLSKSDMMFATAQDDELARLVLSVFNTQFHYLLTDAGVDREAREVVKLAIHSAEDEMRPKDFSLVIELLGLRTVRLSQMIKRDSDDLRTVLKRLAVLGVCRSSYSKRGFCWLPAWAYERIMRRIRTIDGHCS